MANSLTPTDVYAIVNAMSRQMFGSSALQAVDTTTFATVGETMLRTSKENTLDAFYAVMGPTIVAVRPYSSALRLIVQIPEEWGGISRKISFYAKGLQPSGNWNTNLNPNQLVDGQSVDHYVISKKYPLQINFCGIKTEEYEDTTFLHQLNVAFRSPEEFARFTEGKMVDIANDIETKTEADNTLLLLNAMGATYNTGATRSKVNLTAAFNAEFGTTYTTAQLLSTQFKEFMAYFVERVQGDIKLAAKRNELFHVYPARNDDAGNALVLPRHTPESLGRLLLYMPIIRRAEKEIFPSLFNDNYLKFEQFEGVEYWQSPLSGSEINVTPNQMDPTTGNSVDGANVNLEVVLGFYFDRDALAASLKYQSAMTTPINARGKYYNTYYSWAHCWKIDQTENMILYYMAD